MSNPQGESGLSAGVIESFVRLVAWEKKLKSPRTVMDPTVRATELAELDLVHAAARAVAQERGPFTVEALNGKLAQLRSQQP